MDFIVVSTPMKLCLHARVKRFKAMREAMGMAVSSTKTISGFKVHIATNAEGTIAVNFCFSNESTHDVCFLEVLLENCTGSAIGDSNYISQEKTNRLIQKNLKFVAKKRKNMEIQNAKEEKQKLKIRHRIENFNQKLKKLVGEDFSRFRVLASAKAVIAIAILAINLGF
ncbi:MAG: transposase [Puniceicoccales bacterium]|jgi:hypothetical protein|nr:transposase [Puniceicoccales bacterium]